MWWYRENDFAIVGIRVFEVDCAVTEMKKKIKKEKFWSIAG